MDAGLRRHDGLVVIQNLEYLDYPNNLLKPNLRI